MGQLHAILAGVATVISVATFLAPYAHASCVSSFCGIKESPVLSWGVIEPGDIWVMGRYRFAAPGSSPPVLQGYGLNLGLKLPVGRGQFGHAWGDSLTLGINGVSRNRDFNFDWEREDAGANALFLSPGLSYSVRRDFRAYGFLQFPLYQQLNGLQPWATRAAVLGVSAKF